MWRRSSASPSPSGPDPRAHASSCARTPSARPRSHSFSAASAALMSSAASSISAADTRGRGEGGAGRGGASDARNDATIAFWAGVEAAAAASAPRDTTRARTRSSSDACSAFRALRSRATRPADVEGRMGATSDRISFSATTSALSISFAANRDSPTTIRTIGSSAASTSSSSVSYNS